MNVWVGQFNQGSVPAGVIGNRNRSVRAGIWRAPIMLCGEVLHAAAFCISTCIYAGTCLGFCDDNGDNIRYFIRLFGSSGGWIWRRGRYGIGHPFHPLTHSAHPSAQPPTPPAHPAKLTLCPPGTEDSDVILGTYVLPPTGCLYISGRRAAPSLRFSQSSVRGGRNGWPMQYRIKDSGWVR